MSQEAIETLKKVNESVKEMRPKVKKTLYLGVYESGEKGFVGNETSMGIYEAESEQDAREKMADSIIPKYKDGEARKKEIEELALDIYVTPLNGAPIVIASDFD